MNNRIIPFLTLSTLLVAACDVLDVEPAQQVADNQAITNAAGAQAAILGTYSQVQEYYQLNYPVLGYLPADNVIFNGTLSQYLQVDQNAYTPNNDIVTATWTQLYQVINSANNLIEGVPVLTDPTFTADARNRILGEAYLLRALAYFDLGRGWGGVPLVLKPTRSAQDGQGIRRSTLDQTYDQVLGDLDLAEPLLPEVNVAPATTQLRNRAAKNAARALRARLHLYRRQWAEAEGNATRVIGNNGYELVSPYRAFSTAPFGSRESVFELSFTNADPNNQWNNWFPSALGGQFTLQPSPGFVTLVNNPATGGNRNALVATIAIGGTTATYGNLYARSRERDDPAYLIRLAELYLIRAEARAQQNNLAGALADLNAVRKRAGLAEATAATPEAVQLAIENERRIEFAFEAHRWFDLVRTERADDVLGITDRNKWLFPIPFVDIGADPDLEQNPGY
ncbi:MAG: RagB/SusD family nutrient uptake outer membrane protein [Ferruginibacter sp.]|nr:RagB/SusD family nutrient uptake outer membrane protein [Cytophagales bacterium]